MHRRSLRIALFALLAVPFTSFAAGEDKLAEGDKIRLLQWQDGKALDALPLYEEARKAGADEFEVEWRIASAYFWAGENTKDSAKLAEWGGKGVEHAEK